MDQIYEKIIIIIPRFRKGDWHWHNYIKPQKSFSEVISVVCCWIEKCWFNSKAFSNKSAQEKKKLSLFNFLNFPKMLVALFILWNLSLKKQKFEITVKPVYNGHPWDPQKVAVV